MEKTDKHAKVGFILGLVSVAAWFLPIVGFPVTICAIVFSSLGLKSTTRHGKALTGLILGIVFLVITLINSIAGAVLAVYSQQM